MATRVLVNTSEGDEIDVEPVNVVTDDAEVVTIDTLRADLDKLVEEAPRKPEAKAPPPTPVAMPPQPRVVDIIKKKKKKIESPPARRIDAPTPPKRMLDGQSAFQDALRGTIPQGPTVEQQEEMPSLPQPPETFRGPASAEPEEDDGEMESSSGDEDDGEMESSSGDEDDDDSQDIPRQQQPRGVTTGPAVVEEEDEDKAKMRLLEESATMMADGFIPVQQPTYTMSVETLKKIVEQQEGQAAEAFGIGLIGFGWIEVIRMLEILNGKFDPASKVFGPGKGAKLDGASDAVAKNIKRYRGPFRYLWKKMQNKKLEEYSPLITMGLVTFDILKKVHIENARKEMRRNAEETIRTPMGPDAMRRMQEMLQQQQQHDSSVRMPRYRTPSDAQQDPIGYQPPSMVPGEQTPPPASIIQPSPTVETTPAQQSTVDEQQPQMVPVDSIVIPESDDETTAAAAVAREDDDDVVVKVPAASGRGGRRPRRR